jgi:hypothetical protein
MRLADLDFRADLFRPAGSPPRDVSGYLSGVLDAALARPGRPVQAGLGWLRDWDTHPRLKLDHWRRCSRGHRTIADPPDSPLVRIPCGCALATLTPQASLVEFRRILTRAERRDLIAVHVAGRRCP